MAVSKTRVAGTLARCTAVWLAVLVFFPATAPFRTCDLADLLSSHPNHRLPVAPWSGQATAHDDGVGLLVQSLAPVGRQLKIVVLSELIDLRNSVTNVSNLAGLSISYIREEPSGFATVLRV